MHTKWVTKLVPFFIAFMLMGACGAPDNNDDNAPQDTDAPENEPQDTNTPRDNVPNDENMDRNNQDRGAPNKNVIDNDAESDNG